MSKGSLIVIVGPTAVGKTSLSISLAKYYKTDILSADSRQLYKEMEIGTAKPSKEEMQGIQHHFIDTNSIKEKDPFNASKFEKESLHLLDDMFQKKSAALLVGGSGLYVDAICKGFDKEVPSSNKSIRKELDDKLQNDGILALQNMLLELDPVFYQKIDLNNPKRLMRALEVCLITGKPYSEIRKGAIAERPFNIIKIGLERDREELYSRINTRVDEMIQMGLENEVKSLLPFKGQSALKTVGYQEFIQYFEEIMTLDETIEKIKVNSRRYAKRQLTWFKKDPDCQWFHPDNESEIITFINQELKK